MNYIHVIAKMKKSSSPKVKEKTKYYIQSDCVSEDDVLNEILIPYASGASKIMIEGAFVSANDIEQISIFESSEDSKALYQKESVESDARASRLASEGVFSTFVGTTVHSAILRHAQDITSNMLREAIKRQ